MTTTTRPPLGTEPCTTAWCLLQGWLRGTWKPPHFASMTLTVLVLVATTVMLEHFHVFRPLDDAGLSLAIRFSPTKAPALPQENNHEVTVVLIGSTMFERDFARRLPVPTEPLGKLIDALAELQPRRIGIDIDLAHPPREGGERADNAITAAIAAALGRNIDVFGIVYGRQTPEGIHARDLRLAALCESFDASTGGRFALYSAQLKTLGAAHSVIAMPHFDLEDAPHAASLGIATACAGPNPTPSEWCDAVRANDAHARLSGYCEVLKARVAPRSVTPLPGVDDDGQPVKPAPKKASVSPAYLDQLINFTRAEPVPVLILESMDDLAHMADEIRGKLVILGLRSFSGIDEFVTPEGRKPGACIHGHVANSMHFGPLTPAHALAVLIDFLLGMVFSVLALAAIQGAAAVQPRHPNLASTLRFVLLPALLLAMSYFVLWWMPALLAKGIWINPMVMLLGLTVHAYMETQEHEHGQAHSDSHGNMWRDRMRHAVLGKGHQRREQGTQIDRWLGRVGRGAALVLIGAAGSVTLVSSMH